MKIAYRQGIISFQTDGLGGPQFLLPSATPGFIDFDVSPTPTTVAFAHGASNYLVTFDVDSTPGWGPITGGVTSYLYWDIDLLTGGITRGITTLMPVTAPTAPATPDIDQHWFDLTTTTMKVWNGTKWLSKIRLFAGYVPFGVVGSLVHYGANSQVGLTDAVDAGYILTDALLQPLRNGKGEFLTSDTRVLVQSSSGTSGVLTKAPVGFMPVKATENIPAFSLVTFTGADQVGLASGDPALLVPKTPIGIVVDDLSTGEVGMMTQYGEISSDTFPSWFATNIGKPVYCSPTGELTPVRPSGLLAYRVGTVKSPTSLLFQIDAETLVAMVEVGTSNVVINGQAPIVVPAPSINGLGEQVWTVTLPAATVSEAGHMTAAHATTLDTHTTQIADLELTKSDVGHGHVIADVSGLQTALNNKSDIGHTHIIANVAGLQVELDGKAPLVHGHMIADVAGLQTALDGKADLVHPHEIADVNLLQAALDSKSNVGHGHAIADVTGLQTALDGKSDIGHGHAIADVAGLQTALDGKAALVHAHTASEVTDFSEAVDDRVAQLLVAGTNVTLTYDDTANSLTIDAAAGGGSSLPVNEIAVGTGTGITSFSGFIYDTTDNSFYVNVPNVVNANAEIIMRSGANVSASVGESELLMTTAFDGAASDIYLTAGSNQVEAGAEGGDVTITAGRGNGVDGRGGIALMEGGNAHIGGDANVFAGQGGIVAGARGGEAVIQAGNGFEGGWTYVTAGNGVAGEPSSIGGTVRISAGSVTGNDQSSGSIQLRTSATTRLAITGTGEWQLGGLAGNLGQVLTSQGTNSAPVWADPPAGLPAPTDVGYVIAGISGQYEVLSSAGFPAIPVMGNGGFPQLLTGGSNGEVLTYNDSFSPPYTWQAPAAGPTGGVIRVRNTANQHTSDGTMIATWSEVSEYLQGSPWTWNATFGELEFNGAENTVWEITLTLELSGVTWPTGAEIIGAVNLVPGSLGGGNVQPGNAATASWYHPVAVPTNSQKRFSATYVVFGGVGPISYQVGAAYETPGAVATAANAAVMITAKYLGQSNAV